MKSTSTMMEYQNIAVGLAKKLKKSPGIETLNNRWLHWQVCKQGKEILTSLEERGMIFNLEEKDTMAFAKKCVCNSVLYGDTDTVLFFTRKGFDINTPIDDNGNTALHYFVLDQQRKRIKQSASWLHKVLFLLESGADPCLKNIEGYSPVLTCMKDITPMKYSVLHLFVHLGYRAPVTDLKDDGFMKGKGMYDDLLKVAHYKVPSLQSVCAIRFRLEMGSRTREVTSRLHYPKKLKDFILFTDLINFQSMSESAEAKCS